MTKSNLLTWLILPLFLTSCNLFGGLSSPSNDPQHLVSARACLDRGDYDCARTHYQALSKNYNDIQISEASLTTLAQNRIFSITDLVGSLGTALGNATSLSFLAQSLAAKGILSGSYRTIIKTVYDNDSAIVEPNLKSFSKFLASVAMFNETLANAIGPSGKLAASDIVDKTNLAACKAGGACNLSCTAPAGTGLTFDSTDTTSFTTPGSDWSGPATIQKLIVAASEASTELAIFTNGSSSNQGILSALQSLGKVSGAENCVRYLLLQNLSL